MPPDNRDTAGRFIPGVSGNPGGRPKAAITCRKRAQDVSEDMLEVLIDAAVERGKDRVAAARAVLAIAGVTAEHVEIVPEKDRTSLSGVPTGQLLTLKIGNAGT